MVSNLHGPRFQFLNFMGCTETIEEVDEWYTSFNSCQVSYSGQVHYFLYGGFSKHSAYGCTSNHYVLMVTEDGQSVCSQCTSSYWNTPGSNSPATLYKLGSINNNLGDVKVVVNAPACKEPWVAAAAPCFRLHFYNLNSVAEDVLRPDAAIRQCVLALGRWVIG